MKRTKPTGTALNEDQVTIYSLVQRMRQLEQEIRLVKQSLVSLLPEKELPTKRRPVKVLNPRTNKWENI